MAKKRPLNIGEVSRTDLCPLPLFFPYLQLDYLLLVCQQAGHNLHLLPKLFWHYERVKQSVKPPLLQHWIFHIYL
jgi:hypothetical protein